MLAAVDLERLAGKTLELLGGVGAKVEDDALVAVMCRGGCRQGPDGRVRIPAGLVDELAASQKRTQAEDLRDQELLRLFGPDYAHHLIWTGQRESIRREAAERLIVQAFDCGPTRYYDYRAGAARMVDAEVFAEMMKLAETLPEVGYTSTWYRQDLPPRIERLDSLVNGLRCTTKLDGIEAIYPEVIRYLIEAGEIYYGVPGRTWFLAGSESLLSPIVIDRRAAEDMRERARLGVGRYHIATMPTLGVNTPVTPASAVILCCAEILAGMVAAYLLEPEADISGRAICTALDMRTASATTFAPEVHFVNLGTREVFNAFWGGHVWCEIHFSPSARRPGLEAVIEYALGSARYAQMAGAYEILYTGMGTLENGATGSPTQLMLDLEMRKMLHHCARGFPVDEETMAFDLLSDHVRCGTDLLSSEHTLEHFRGMYAPDLFWSTFSGCRGTGHGSEKEILDRADALWRESLAKWEPPAVPDDKMRALDDLLTRARLDLLE